MPSERQPEFKSIGLRVYYEEGSRSEVRQVIGTQTAQRGRVITHTMRMTLTQEGGRQVGHLMNTCTVMCWDVVPPENSLSFYSPHKFKLQC